jgi:hypothetical protein
MDQSLFAAPHGLSQRITSFIACACQGIHQLPLFHFIVLIANDHHPTPKECRIERRSQTYDILTTSDKDPTSLDQLLETCGLMRGQATPTMTTLREPDQANPAASTNDDILTGKALNPDFHLNGEQFPHVFSLRFG